ncbi:Ig-like domain-containing protein, partial [Chloroflexota bacterium]
MDVDIAAFVTDLRASPGDTYLVDTILHIIEFINGTNISIGHATSTDGISWTKDAGNPVLEGDSDDWDKYGVGTPSVIKTDGTYEMWYTGCEIDYIALLALLNAEDTDDIETALLNSISVSIGRATSTDGVSWTKDAGNPILEKGSSSAWDSYGIGTPSVIRNSASSYEMWYTGAKMVPDTLLNFFRNTIRVETAVLDGTDFAIGHATSSNGISWTKDTGNPILENGSSSAWDKYGVGTPSVIKTGSNYELWYTGGQANTLLLLTNILDSVALDTALSNSSTSVGIGRASTTPRTLQSIAVTPTSTSVAVSNTKQFTATGSYSDSSTADLTTTVTWDSSNTAKATIGGSTGLATGVETGSTVITASLG